MNTNYTSWLIISIIIIIGMIFSVQAKKLTVMASLTGGVIGLAIFSGAGFVGLILMAAFFVLGSFVTVWKIDRKENMGFAEKNKGQRSPAQVLANGGLAALLGICIVIFPQYKDQLVIMIAAAFSAATADTISSELGTLYGHRFYNICTFKKDTRGLDGVVSLEGFLFGIVGSFLIAVIYSLFEGFNLAFVWIVLAGTFGNLVDSLLGATFERKQLLKNNWVNFLNTVSGAIFAGFIYFF